MKNQLIKARINPSLKIKLRQEKADLIREFPTIDFDESKVVRHCIESYFIFKRQFKGE